MKKNVSTGLTLLFLLFTACSKKNNDNVAPKQTPGKALLTFPAQNAACTSGAINASNQVEITFTWNSSANTNGYQLVVTNLINRDVIIETTGKNNLIISLDFNTPYSWYVVSTENGTTATAQSETWKFYLSGPGAVSHPPFPADHLIPAFGQAVTFASGGISLEWEGSSPDNDIVSYDVYMDTLKTPVLFKSSITTTYLSYVKVLPNHTYYWKVITKDSAGNTSDSGISQFKID